MKTNLIPLVALLAFALCGCERKPQAATQLSFYYVSETPSGLTRPAVVNGETIYLIEPPAIVSPMVKDTYSSLDIHGRPYIFIKFGEPTTSDFAAVSRAAIGKRLAIVVSGETIVAPVIREPISNGVFSISGPFSEKKARDITYSILGLDHPVK